jgi:serine/threonine protein kinase
MNFNWSTTDAADINTRYSSIRRGVKLAHGTVTVFKGKSQWECSRLGIKNDMKILIFKHKRASEHVWREMKILRCLNRHPCILHLLEVLPQSATYAKALTVCMVREFPDVRLATYLGESRYFNEFEVQSMLYGVMCGVFHMHGAGIVHGNLRPSAILINYAECTAKITDFRQAYSVFESGEKLMKWRSRSPSPSSSSSRKKQRKKRRSVKYPAPELFLGSNLRSVQSMIENNRYERTKRRRRRIELLAASDLWSIGCIFSDFADMQASINKRRPLFGKISDFNDIPRIFHLIGYPTASEIADIDNENARKSISCCTEFATEQPSHMRFNLSDTIKQERFSERFPGMSTDGMSLIQSLLTFDYKKRITANECLNHPYFERVRDAERLEFMPFDITMRNETLVYGYFRILNSHLSTAAAPNEIPFRIPLTVQSLILTFYSYSRRDHSCQQEFERYGAIQLSLNRSRNRNRSRSHSHSQCHCQSPMQRVHNRQRQRQRKRHNTMPVEMAIMDDDDVHENRDLKRTILRSKISEEISYYSAVADRQTKQQQQQKEFLNLF